jgi:dTDP-4-amino-4,6-dideoxygalactose transaminase
VSHEPWLEFRERTGIPIVIDGAATFETATSQPERILGELPVAMSFHATKAFATGEGGCVASTETVLVEQIGQALNFGFWGSRDSATPSLNGKLSEYHAAVGLAELDGWPAKRDQLEGVVALYVDAFASVGLSDRLVCAPTVGLSYILFRAGDVAESACVQRSLRARGIDFRLWYGRGVHDHTHFADVARGRLDTAEDLAARLIGLPVAPDLAPDEVRRVADAVRVGAAAEAR